MTLSVDVRHRLGAFELDAAFESSGRLTALFGPSGSGKTTLVNMIAGLIRPGRGPHRRRRPRAGRHRKRIFVPKHRRRIGYVFQDARLFPHMTRPAEPALWPLVRAARRALCRKEQVVELLGIGDLLDRRPSLLSGGEKQRVAIGRALLASPQLILMDEPLASLDEARKAEILPYIERLRDEIKVPIVYVSHSVAEVARLATDIVVLGAGKVVASGPTADIMQRLDLLPDDERGEGGAVLDMTVAGHDERFGMTVLALAGGRDPRAAARAALGAAVRAAHPRPRRDASPPSGRRASARSTSWPARSAASRPGEGPLVDVGIDCNGQAIVARLTRQSTQALDLRLGQEVFAVIKTVSFDRGNTTRGMRFEA